MSPSYKPSPPKRRELERPSFVARPRLSPADFSDPAEYIVHALNNNSLPSSPSRFSLTRQDHLITCCRSLLHLSNAPLLLIDAIITLLLHLQETHPLDSTSPHKPFNYLDPYAQFVTVLEQLSLAGAGGFWLTGEDWRVLARGQPVWAGRMWMGPVYWPDLRRYARKRGLDVKGFCEGHIAAGTFKTLSSNLSAPSSPSSALTSTPSTPTHSSHSSSFSSSPSPSFTSSPSSSLASSTSSLSSSSTRSATSSRKTRRCVYVDPNVQEVTFIICGCPKHAVRHEEVVVAWEKE